MTEAARGVGSRWILDRSELGGLITALRAGGYKVVGPTVRDGAMGYGELRTDTDLPIGWTDRQAAGAYRLERRNDAAVFGFAVGPHSWRRFLSPPRETLWTAVKTEDGFEIRPTPARDPPLALLGVRACEIAAMGVSDRVFDGAIKDPGYVTRRDRSLRIAVQCGEPGGTCFCVSMGTGPAVRHGFDLSMTEILAPGPHHFVVEIGSEKGAKAIAAVPMRPAEDADRHAVEAVVARSAERMGRSFEPDGVRELLATNLEHPRWEIVAKRCLSCANCTMVCPTCFCSTTEEVPDLTGATSERHRRWDSCFNLGFSALHATSVRTSTKSRYRQWLTHKLSTWHDQFGVSGCVGCGRCITWCPVGIDLTEEVAAIRVVPALVAPAGEGSVTDATPPTVIRRTIAEHPFFHGLDATFIEQVAHRAVERRFETGELLVEEGETADAFHLVEHGKIALEIAAPDRPRRTIQTIGRGEVLGWSWLVPPYRWAFDARALKPTHSVALDAEVLRRVLAAHPESGYRFLMRLLPVIAQRLENTHLQLLDIHGL